MKPLDAPEPLCEALAIAIRQRRRLGKLSRHELATLTGLSRQTISLIEANHCTPSIEIVARISRAFGVPCSKLLVEAEIELKLNPKT